MASGHMNRVNRPDTWLHRPMLQNVKKVLANSEPSTHDPEQKSEIKIVRISDTGTSLESEVRSSNLFGRATTPFKPLGGSHP